MQAPLQSSKMPRFSWQLPKPLMAGAHISLGEWVDRDACRYRVSIHDYSEMRSGGRGRMGYRLCAYPVGQAGGPVVIDLYGSHLDFLYHRLAWEVEDSDGYREELLKTFIEGCRRAIFMKYVRGATEIRLSNQPDSPLGLHCMQPRMSDVPVFLLQEDPDFEPELAKYARTTIVRYLKPAYLSGKSYDGIYQVVAGPGNTELADLQAEWLVKKGYAEYRSTGHEVSRSLGITDDGLEFLQRLEAGTSPAVSGNGSVAPGGEQIYDCFICHASEDKERFVDALASRHRNAGCSVWYDDFVLRVGDRLRRRIDEGQSRSKHGVAVLSPAFFQKEWPQKELDGLVAQAKERGILPVWLDVTKDDVVLFSPTLAGVVAARAGDGLDAVVRAPMVAMGKLSPVGRSPTVAGSAPSAAQFTKQESELLAVAAQDGKLYHLKAAQIPAGWVRAGRRDYIDKSDPSVAAQYVDALESLVSKGCAKHGGGMLYVLTGRGFTAARGLASQGAA